SFFSVFFQSFGNGLTALPFLDLHSTIHLGQNLSSISIQLFIQIHRTQQAVVDSPPQADRRLDNYIRQMPHDVADQFTRIAVGETQQIIIAIPGTDLLWMPLLQCNFPCDFWIEAQLCGVLTFAGKNPVAFSEMLLKLFARNFSGFFTVAYYRYNTRQRECTQIITQVTPGIEIPVFTVVDECLRADGAGAELMGITFVADEYLLPFQQGFADCLKHFSGYMPITQRQYLDVFDKGTG